MFILDSSKLGAATLVTATSVAIPADGCDPPRCPMTGGRIDRLWEIDARTDGLADRLPARGSAPFRRGSGGSGSPSQAS